MYISAMAGIGLVLDLLKRGPLASTRPLHSSAFFSAPVATTTAVSALAFYPSYPTFASQLLFSGGAGSIAYCDAGATWNEFGYPSDIYRANGVPRYGAAPEFKAKTYNVELKPLLSAFGWKTLGLTTLRALLMFYLPLLEPRTDLENDDEDTIDEDLHEEHHVDLIVPLKKSVKQIFRETAVLTTRRVLERLTVQYVSQRMAWKLLKDLPKSAERKARRHMSSFQLFVCVSKSTFRGHSLGVAASWVVQVGIEAYHYIYGLYKHPNQGDKSYAIQEFKRRIMSTTVRCGASLIFASIGAGLGAIIIRPSSGQWIGCAAGDMAGPFLVGLLLENFNV